MSTDTDVVEDAHFPEQIQVLECPRDSQPGAGMSGGAGNVGAVQHNPARVGAIETGNEVEERGLSCSVRTYDAEDFIAAEGQGDILQRPETTEADPEFSTFKRALFSDRPRRCSVVGSTVCATTRGPSLLSTL